ncbi:ankyrin repeat-containing domain protein [Tuber indicum]|nr:ankyrin repeat-containing domain protein [Tuber indicum]
MPFAHLPNEIILQISEHLPPRAISALGRTTQRYANLLKLPLYDSLIRPSVTDTYRGRALCALLLRGDKPLVRRLLRKDIISLLPPRDAFEYIAAETDWSERAIQTLLDSGFDPETRGGYGMTPLMSAIFSGREAVVKLLLTRQEVRNSRAVDDMAYPPIHFATTCGVPEILRILLEIPTFNVNLPGSRGWTPLHSAAVFGEGASASLLLAHPEIDVNTVDNERSTPLISAVRSGVVNLPRVVQLLAEDGRVNVNARDNQGRTALHWAIAERDEEAVRILLKREDLNICVPDHTGLTPLDWGYKVLDPEDDEYLLVFLADERVGRWVSTGQEIGDVFVEG